MRVGPCGALTQTVPGLAGEVGCVRGQALPSMEGAAGLSRRIFPKRKRPSGTLWGIPFSNSSSLLSTQLPAQCSCRGVGAIKPRSEALGRECTPRGSLRPQAVTGSMRTSPPGRRWGGPETTGTRESVNQERPCTHTYSQEEGECLNLWVWGLLESWDEGCLSAGWDGEELG